MHGFFEWCEDKVKWEMRIMFVRALSGLIRVETWTKVFYAWTKKGKIVGITCLLGWDELESQIG